MSGFVKNGDLEFVSQMNNFSEKLPNYQSVLGLSAATLTAVANDAAMMAFGATAIDTARTYKEGWTQFKDNARFGKGENLLDTFPSPVDVSSPPTAVLPGIEGRFRALVRQIKANPAYTTQMGEDLGIVQDEDNTELMQPTLTLKLDANHPLIGFVKGGNDGINLYCKRSGQDDFSLLTFRSRSPYSDTRPNVTPGTPETRQYKAIFVKDDEEHGTQSSVVSITVD